MCLDFLDQYWIHNRVSANKHFAGLNKELISSVGCPAIPEDKIKTMYKGSKRWDLHFVDKKIAIEYKTIATERQQQFVLKVHDTKALHSNIARNIGNRIEEALGNSKDLKDLHPDYKLGYILVLTLKREDGIIVPKKIIKKTIDTFDKMVKNKVYDFFCPLITFGPNDHEELSKDYTFSKFISQIKNSPRIELSPFAEFFV